MTKRMAFIIRALHICGGSLTPPHGLCSHQWLLKWKPNGSCLYSSQWLYNDTIQRMLNLGFLSRRDDEGKLLDGLRPTSEALRLLELR